MTGIRGRIFYQCEKEQILLGFTYAFPQFAAGAPAFVADALFQHAEDSPHTGFYIPFHAAGAVEVVAGAGSAVF